MDDSFKPKCSISNFSWNFIFLLDLWLAVTVLKCTFTKLETIYQSLLQYRSSSHNICILFNLSGNWIVETELIFGLLNPGFPVNKDYFFK